MIEYLNLMQPMIVLTPIILKKHIEELEAQVC
jgi:hypothetical protein